MRRIDRLIGRGASVDRYSLNDWATDASFGFGGQRYPLGFQTTWGTDKAEMIGNNFEGYVQSAYRANGVVFAVILALPTVAKKLPTKRRRATGNLRTATVAHGAPMVLTRPATDRPAGPEPLAMPSPLAGATSASGEPA